MEQNNNKTEEVVADVIGGTLDIVFNSDVIVTVADAAINIGLNAVSHIA